MRMKKEYVKPESFLYSIAFDENIASSGGEGMGEDQISGAMTILFSHSVSPCRDFYTRSDKPVSVPDGSTFFQYFMEMQSLGAPAGCLQLIQ